MLEEIRIGHLGVIESSRLELGRGLTVITGETGAGKTMVVTALGLLLGGRADSGMVRTGAGTARVEGVVDATGVDVKGDVQACFEGELKLTFYTREQENACLGKAEMRVSAKKGNGLAISACGQADFGKWSGSFGWAVKSTETEDKVEVLAGSCDVDAWHTPASASAARIFASS